MNSDQVVLENPYLLAGKWKQPETAFAPPQPHSAPSGIINHIPDDAYKAYTHGRDRACIDLVLCTRAPDGPAVALSKRNKDNSYGDLWWVYGGALPAYTPIEEFITKRAEHESGVATAPQVLVGVYRIGAPDRVDSAITVCFAAEVPYVELVQKMRTDEAHQEMRLFTLQELESLPPQEKHWYPMRVAQLALNAMTNS